MTSGNRSDVKEDAYRYVGVTDIQRECRILYLACAVLHAVMALCFMKLEINIMLYESAGEYPKVCVNLQTDVRYNYSVWRLFLWQEKKTAHKKQQ